MIKLRANQIAGKALQVRKRYLNVGAHVPICPYNLADAMGLDVRFVQIPSFEGMYLSDENLILISAERPEGRKRFTCAHEIGHHVLGHGTSIDEIVESGPNSQIETEADFFAGMLMMPSSAVVKTARSAGFDLSKLIPIEAYCLSKYFGLSYAGFLAQLCFSLKLIDRRTHDGLKKVSLKEIKSQIIPFETDNQVIAIYDWWLNRAIDLEVGDFVVSRTNCVLEGGDIASAVPNADCCVYKATRPGIARLTTENWASFIRVSEKDYAGMLQYRHQEEVE